MEIVSTLLDLFLHLDEHLVDVATTYGAWIYALLFAIIFLETGVVATPFLPGDSLLFAAGALAAAGAVDIGVLLLLLTAAAILGDSVNYAIGRALGPRVFTEHRRLLNREHLLRTQRFYERHGGKTIVLARFVPIVRTFAPFVAGVGAMRYPRFLAFNVGGGCAWAGGFLLLGYFFGNQPIVKEHFGFVILAVIVISLLPVTYEAWRARNGRHPAA
ncbi:MAG TPA: DedA family protein [Gammaproteobacteria bacterium]